MTNFNNKVIVDASKLLIITAFVCLCSAATISANKTNFSGVWKIDTARSAFGGAPTYIAPKQMNVVQQAGTITIMRLNAEDKSYTEILPFAQTNFEVKTATNRTKTGDLRWSDDGSSLTETAIYSAENTPDKQAYKMTESWHLSKDGQSLVADMAFEISQNTRYSVKVVYDKQ